MCITTGPAIQPPEWKSTTVLPYIRGVSEPLTCILRVRVCFKPFQTLRTLLSRPKNTIPDLQKSSVVYKIPCAHCPASYVGQTSRRLCQRLEEHKRAVRAADFNSSALAEHAWMKNHPVNWSNPVTCTPH